MTSGRTSRASPARAGVILNRRTRGTRRSESRSWYWCTWSPSSSPSRGLTRPDAMCTSCPRSARRVAQRAKWRDFASPMPRMRSRSSAIRLPREHDHLLVVGMVPVAGVRHRQARARAGGAKRLEVVVVAVSVVARGDTLRLLDVAEIRLAPRVLVDRREEAAAGAQHLRHLEQAARDRVDRQVREDRLRDGVVEAQSEPLELEGPVHEQVRGLVLQPLARQLDLARAVEIVPPLVDSRVVAGLEVADEVNSRPQRPAPDIEDVVARLQPLLDEVVELQLAKLVPEGLAAAHRAAVPVGIPEAPVARGEGAANTPLDPEGHVRLDLLHHAGHPRESSCAPEEVAADAYAPPAGRSRAARGGAGRQASGRTPAATSGESPRRLRSARRRRGG